jgi:integrating conjugative element protein (TIGR03756 family)
MTNLSFALESTKPPHPLNTFTLASRVLQKLFSNSHYKVIGSCTWATGHFPPKIDVTPAVEQFLPDLIITVSHKPEENPWLEARFIYENKAARTLYQQAYKIATGFELGFGNDSGQTTNFHINDERTKIVDVIGSPLVFYQIPFLSHQAETAFGAPYYLAEADAVMDRTEMAELLYMATHPHLLINHEIGS